MKALLLVALGGALGATARYGAGILVRLHLTDSWPLATLLVNVLGSLGIGVVFVLLERSAIHLDFRSLVVVGFFGAFTTFSTFSLELLHMVQRDQAWAAVGYALISVFTCFAGTLVGVQITRALV